MNKADLLDALEGPLGSRKAAADAVEALVDVIIREVAAGGRVGITGFGTFEPVQRAARTGRNPRTGETVRIEGTTIARFRPGTQFRDVVAEPSLLPATGLAGLRSATPARPSSEADAPARAARSTKAAKAKAAKASKVTEGTSATAANAETSSTPKAAKAAKAAKPAKAKAKADGKPEKKKSKKK